MNLPRPGPAESRPLICEERKDPVPGPGEIRVAVSVCAVCRTDLHLVEGDLLPKAAGIVPGHQIVGRVDGLGPEASRFSLGDRVGVAWVSAFCGECRFCGKARENLCQFPRFTGWDRDGGFAERVTVPEAAVYELPSAISDAQAAPLLCAGIIGYRAISRAGIEPGGRVGLFGFGGSAHIAIQVARHRGCEVYVFSRGGRHREHAERLGATWIGDSHETPPHPLDSAVLFAPAGELVPVALASLDRGGTLAVAGIHLSEIPPLDYDAHLFQERTLTSVTANTRADGSEHLRLAAEIPIETDVHPYPLEAANEALIDLKQDRIQGSAILEIAPGMTEIGTR